MTTKEIEARVRTVLADVFGLDPEQIDEDSSRDTIEQWDSVHHLTLVLALEEEFEIQLDEEETLAVVTFPLITAVVTERLGSLEST